MGTILKILVASILVNNYVLGQFLGICPLIGVSNKVETAFGMGYIRNYNFKCCNLDNPKDIIGYFRT